MKRSALPLLLLVLFSALPASADQVAIEIQPKSVVAPVDLVLTAHPLRQVEGETSPPKPQELSLSAPGYGSLDLDRRVPWRLEGRAAGYWMPSTLLSPSSWPSRLSLNLWRTGLISGTLRVLAGEELPPSIAIRFSAAGTDPTKNGDPHGSIECPLEKSKVSCAVPAGRLDLDLRAAGFMASYRWDLDLPAGGETSLGPIELRRGSSLTGWVQVSAGTLDPDQCEITLEPAIEPQSSETLLHQLAKLQLKTQPTKRGFFQLLGVPPGTYVLRARQPGLVSAPVFPISVAPGLQFEMQEPLVLEQLLTLQVAAFPAEDFLGQGWRVKVDRPTVPEGVLDQAALLSLPAAGQLEIPHLEAGPYVVTLLDGQGAPWATEEVSLATGSTAVTFQLSMTPFEGSIKIGKTPLRAKLWFGGKRGVPAIATESDEHGQFAGVVPREGAWRVEIEAESPKVRRTLARVLVEVSPNGAKAIVEIRLPATKLTGVVVDEGGLPVAEARVGLVEGGQPAFETTDADGAFAFHAISVGDLLLFADKGPLRSDDLFLSIQEGVEPFPAELRLRSLKAIQGSIRTPHGPIPGARVIALPFVGGVLSLKPAQTISDASGRFTLQVPSNATELQLIGLPMGTALALGRFGLAVEQPNLTLTVTGLGGTLRVELPDLSEDDSHPMQPVIWADGLALDVNLLQMWARTHGEPNAQATSLVVPRLPAGNYQICWLPGLAADPRATLGGLREPPRGCESGFLAEGSELVLKAPALAAREAPKD